MSVLWALPGALAIIGVASGGVLGQIAFMAGWVVLGPATLAAWVVGNRIAQGRSARLRDFGEALRARLVPGLLFFLVEVLITVLLVANVRFYFSSTLGVLGHPVEVLGEGIRVGHLVGLLWLSPLTLWALMQLYVPTLMAEQGVGVGPALRRAAVLVLDNIIFSLSLALVVAVLGGILLLSGVGMVALFAGVLAVLTSNALRELLTRYARSSPQAEEPEGASAGTPAPGE